MKFYTLLLFAIQLLFSIDLAAQTVGARVGVNFASQVWKAEETTYHTPSTIAPHLGINLNITEFENVSTQIELTYSAFGFGKIKDSNNGPSYFHYLKLGCAIKVYPITSLSILVGPELGFQLVGERTFLTGGDFGAFGGIDFFPFKFVGLGGRYYFGFTDLNGDPELKQHNRAFQFSLLFRFDSQQLKEMGH